MLEELDGSCGCFEGHFALCVWTDGDLCGLVADFGVVGSLLRYYSKGRGVYL